MSEHYFASNPAIESKLRSVEFTVQDTLFKLQASSGTFSATRLDAGTKALLGYLDDVSGDVLDIGCGWGPIAISIAKLYPATKVWALDINQRSLELTRLNAKSANLGNVMAVTESEISADQTFNQIWSNPPIRVGKEVLHTLMRTWLPRLRPGGSATLVVQKQLGADSFTKWLADEFPELKVERIGTEKGYRIIRGSKVD
jgi:16S rRNA (guanine1207-N2)-methyltransferase